MAGAVRSPDPFRHPQFPLPVAPVPRARTAHWASTSWLVRAACHLHESRGSEHRYRAKYRWLTSICSINKVNLCLNWAVPCRGNALHKVGIGMSDGTVLTRLPAGESGVRNIQCPVKGDNGSRPLTPSTHLFPRHFGTGPNLAIFLSGVYSAAHTLSPDAAPSGRNLRANREGRGAAECGRPRVS